VRKRVPLILLPLLSLLALCAWAGPARSRGDVGELCLRHGIGGATEVGGVRDAWSRAIRAGIPEGEVTPFLEDLLARRLDGGQSARVLDATTKARKAGLPYFVLFSKAREGLAKGASPVQVVEAVEAKVEALSASRDVLESLRSRGYRVLDFQNASIIVSTYLGKGYSKEEIVSEIDRKGILGAGFAALSDVVRGPKTREER
jgi:hypothetical protein